MYRGRYSYWEIRNEPQIADACKKALRILSKKSWRDLKRIEEGDEVVQMNVEIKSTGFGRCRLRVIASETEIVSRVIFKEKREALAWDFMVDMTQWPKAMDVLEDRYTIIV